MFTIKFIPIYLLVFLFSGSSLLAQQPAILKCLETDINGAVTVSWTPPEDLTGFVNYKIYYSKNGNTFNLIETIITPETNQYFHAASEANLARRYYYIQTDFDQGSPLSDTLQTIFLQLDNNAPDYNRADLYWNTLHDPLPEGSSGWFLIYREIPPGNWQLTDSVPNDSLFYSKPEIVCHDSISYRIGLKNDNGCRSVSNVQGATFKDTEYPVKPVFDSVSINLNENAVLGWEPSTSNDVAGYIIYREENSTWIEIDRIAGRDSTFYVDTVATPCMETVSYAIASMDSCENKSPGTFLQPRKTILLNNILYNVCEETNTLTWSQYINALPDLEGYKIFSSRDGGPFELVGQTEPGDTIFIHQSSEYDYYIQAFFESGTSSSCRKSVTASGYRKPDYVYFANADVLPDNDIELSFEVDTLPGNCNVQIFRSDPNGGNPSVIGSVTCTKPATLPLTFTDTSANASLGFYEYDLKVLDSCGREALESNLLKTIYLTGGNVDADHNYLKWNAFGGWGGGVKQYYIFRMTGGVDPTGPIDSVDAQTLEYTDDISSLPDSETQPVYWVQAVEDEGGEYGYREKARSNRIGAAPESEMFLPNAFKPNGITPEFKPVFRFFSGTEYLLQIYNRWGQLIFETHNPQEGWNGQYKGNPVSQGVYVYKLSYRNPDKSPVMKRGTVMVVY
ncbi:MAG: gliding motility-associated C-terminal domain-containing protein [Chlorobi bacterium]|nr:gliding motility-associated C-terminal domain-containing protein [Chlorobiota bacterium]